MIADRTFQGCAFLEEVRLPSSLEEIGKSAFSRSGLRQFSAPSRLQSIGDAAFLGCERLAKAWLNRNLEHLGLLCFFGAGVEEVKLPRRVEMSP